MSSAKCERPIYTPALTRCNTKKGTGAGFRRDEKTLPGSPSPNHHNCSTATACSVHTQLCNCKTVQLQNCTTLQLRQNQVAFPVVFANTSVSLTSTRPGWIRHA